MRLSNPARPVERDYLESPFEIAPQPTSNVVFVTDTTSTQGASETPSSPLDVTMLAMLGLTMAGAGVMKSQSAQKKQHELAQANAIAQAQLATAKAEQAQTARANWEQNQAMQANANKKVYTKVQQSQANIDFWAAFAEWQQRGLERIRNLLYILQNTRVTFTLIDANGVPNYSLGTIANYNGRQVLVTHDHFDKANPNQQNSLAFIQQNFPLVHIQGSLNGTFINTADLLVEYRNPGVIFLSLANGNDFGVTPIAAEIAFNYRPSPDEICFYSYLPGFNSNDNVNASVIYPTLQLNQSITQYTVADYNAFLLHSGATIPLPSGLNNPNGFVINYANGGQGDSGTGLFNSRGELIGVFQTNSAYMSIKMRVLHVSELTVGLLGEMSYLQGGF